jgi:hypothetical protein
MLLFWILMLVLAIVIFGVGFFFRVFLWIGIALLIIWVIAIIVRMLRRG